MRVRTCFKNLFYFGLAAHLAFLAPIEATAQEPDIVEDSVRDILTVVSIGAAGAILGLSTLSFVDKPQDHLKNIVVGGAVGIIIGVGVVAYNQANQSRSYYEMHALSPEFETHQRVSWHRELESQQQARAHSFGSGPQHLDDGLQVNYSFSF